MVGFMVGAAQTVGVGVEIHPLIPSDGCEAGFVKHTLPHTTKARGREVTPFDGNGAGVAVDDLDNDGDLDVVFANLAGENSVFWNEGGLGFRKESLKFGDSRAVATPDVDSDGLQDLVFTRTRGTPTYLHNTGSGFVEEPLRGVYAPAHVMLWFDADLDGDLDLATASYDALLEKEWGQGFFSSAGGGVWVYLKGPDGFVGSKLSSSAQALALAHFDVDLDGTRDLLVGNDFGVPDFVWRYADGAWFETPPFATTTRNTMSFDVGDIDNDGFLELFATDMKPDFGDAKALAAWTPLMERGYRHKLRSDPQREENALQRRTPNGFKNVAYRLGVDATGWSWSGRFGDLDNDGYLDLYVVNGMIDVETLGHLFGGELIEKNVAFHNEGRSFQRATEWGLDALESGRGVTMADFDNDGDLDIVINNLEAPAVLFENRLCGGAGLEVDLTWPESGNTRALGAVLKLHTGEGTFMREVKSGGGYLSGDPARVHFGIPEGAAVTGLDILWPDGAASQLADLSANTLLTVTREAKP